jgi:hypothetical protein
MTEDDQGTPVDGDRIREGISVSDEVSIRTRVYFSHTHIRAAALFAQEAGGLENEYADYSNGPEEIRHAHQGYVASSLVNSALFLESTVNEFYSDILEEIVQRKKYDFKEEFVDAVRDTKTPIDKTNFTYLSTLDKYQWLLLLAHEDAFHLGKVPYQDVSIVMYLRNAFTHYEPENMLVSSTEEQPEIHNLIKSLDTKPVSVNPLAGGGDPSFPTKCLSSSCASWGVSSVMSFTDEFFDRFDARPPYDHIRSEITVDSGTL